MIKERYNVVFDGQIAEGISEETVRRELAISLQLNAQTIDRLFSNASSVLKKNIDLKTAKKYRDVLKKAGLLCKIFSTTGHPINDPDHDLAQLTLETPSFSNDTFICPSCGFEQTKHTECQQCGIIFSKYRKSELERQAAKDTTAQMPSPHESLQHQTNSQVGRRRYLFPLGVIALAAVLFAGYLVWKNLQNPEGAVRYNPERLKAIQKRWIRAHSDLLLQAKALESGGQLDIVYGHCDAPGPAALVALLNDSENVNIDAIAPCIIRFPDVSVIPPLINWYTLLNRNEQRALEEDLKTFFLKIGDPAIDPLMTEMNALEDPYAVEVILKSMALINSKASATTLANVLETGPQEIQAAGAAIIEAVISSRHLEPNRAFALAVSLARSPDPNIRQRIADCLDIFEGETVYMLAIAGCTDDNNRVKAAYKNLRTRLENKNKPEPPQPKAVAKNNEVPPKKEAPPKEAMDTEKKESIWDYTSAMLYCRQQSENIGIMPIKTGLTVNRFFKKLKKAGWLPKKNHDMVITAKGKNTTLTLHFGKDEFGAIVIEKITQADFALKNSVIEAENRGGIILDPCLFINMLE